MEQCLRSKVGCSAGKEREEVQVEGLMVSVQVTHRHELHRGKEGEEAARQRGSEEEGQSGREAVR